MASTRAAELVKSCHPGLENIEWVWRPWVTWRTWRTWKRWKISTRWLKSHQKTSEGERQAYVCWGLIKIFIACLLKWSREQSFSSRHPIYGIYRNGWKNHNIRAWRTWSWVSSELENVKWLLQPWLQYNWREKIKNKVFKLLFEFLQPTTLQINPTIQTPQSRNPPNVAQSSLNMHFILDNPLNTSNDILNSFTKKKIC